MMFESILKPDTIDSTDNSTIDNSTTDNSTTDKPIENISNISDDEIINSEDDNLGEDDIDTDRDNLVSVVCYDLEEEQNYEKIQNEYHILKQSGDWYYAKMIVSHAYQDKNNTELFCDHLEKQLQKNNDSFDRVIKAYYKNDLDIDIIYEFAKEPAKHLIDNLRIPAYKQPGIIFSNPEDANKWSFKIVVITTKGIYTANRYITEDLMGFY